MSISKYLNREEHIELGLDKALEEIEREKGILYDIDVVDACLRLFREKHYKFKEIVTA